MSNDAKRPDDKLGLLARLFQFIRGKKAPLTGYGGMPKPPRQIPPQPDDAGDKGDK